MRSRGNVADRPAGGDIFSSHSLPGTAAMKAQSSSIAALCIALFFVAGCDAQGDGASPASGPLPNSLADTSTHVARRPIPTYGPALAVDSTRSHVARGQVLYVPVYSHIFHWTGAREFHLTATLSIRNTSPTTLLRIREVDYFDSAERVISFAARSEQTSEVSVGTEACMSAHSSRAPWASHVSTSWPRTLRI